MPRAAATFFHPVIDWLTRPRPDRRLLIHDAERRLHRELAGALLDHFNHRMAGEASIP